MKLLVIGMYIFQILVSLGLSKLNDSNLKKPLPESVKDLYSKEKYEKFLAYKAENRKVSRISMFFSFILTMVFLGFNLHAKIYALLPFNIYLNNFILVMLISLIELPIEIIADYYRTFTIEEKYGFNKMTVKTFIIDQIKNILLTTVLMLVIVVLLIYFYSRFANVGMVILFGIAMIFILLINLFSIYVLRIFNKFVPLEEGELKDKITDLCQNNGLIVKSIVVMDASTRTTRANAFCTGITNKKDISLDDNLINLMEEDEILAVFSHEVGHAHYNHMIKQLFVGLLQFVVYFVVIAFLLNFDIYTSFGFKEMNYAFMFEVFPILVYPISFVYELISNAFSRRCEKQADLFAYKLGYGDALIRALKKLGTSDLMNLNPHPWVVKVEYSHPPLASRIDTLQKGE